jgi:hypothetical protein
MTPEAIRSAQAVIEFAGWRAAVNHAHLAVEQMREVVEDLRRAGLYEHSDKLREIAQRLDDAASYPMPRPNAA